MEISRNNVSPEIERVTLKISTDDYWPAYKKELNDVARKTDMKGFRKGKTPLGFVQKTQGQSILYRIIFDMINKKMEEFLNSEELEFSFSPIPADTQKSFTFDPKDKEDYTFEFDLLISPTLEDFKGWATDNEYEYLVVKDIDERIDEEIEHLRRNNADLEDVEEVVVEDSTGITFELNPPDDQSDLQPFNMKFIWSEFSQEFKEKLTAKKVGDEIHGTIEKAILEPYRDNVVSTYERKVKEQSEEEDPDVVLPENFYSVKWTWAIDGVSVKKIPELNEDFLKKISPPEQPIESFDKLREIIGENIQMELKSKSDNLVFHEFTQRIKTKNDFDLPQKFVDEFILGDDKGRELTEEEKQESMFHLLVGKLSDKYDVKVTEEEIKGFLLNQIRSQFGAGAHPQIVEMLYARMSEDENSKNEARNSIFGSKIIKKVVEEVNKVEKEVSLEELEEKLKATFPDRSEEE